MISSRVVSKGLRCGYCRLSILDACLYPRGFPSQSIPASRLLKPTLGHRTWSRRAGQLAPERTEQPTELIARAGRGLEDEEGQESQEHVDADASLHTNDTTPWYLQVEPPERKSTSLLQRQKLPDIPPDPPPLLQPMLEHIFLDLGLDDLTLFDLRELDPPPALGANLVMVICTARSEKHLHVSADKFCQWMKNTHQIAPYADGLLGRGELKLKLKRKAKRARILSRVGASETNQVDDGIRTGWICVTVENLEDGRPVPEVQGRSDDYVGFGSEDGGAKLVIQMLTQEKREDLDLEDLWGKTMRRHKRREDRISQGLEDSDVQQEVGQNPTFDEGTISDRSPVLVLRPHSLPMANHSQIRQLHHSATHRGRRLVPGHRIHSGAAAMAHAEPNSEVSQDISSDSVETGEVITTPSANDGQQPRHDSIEKAATSKLQAHIDLAENLFPTEARSLLGKGAQDTGSTSFLRSFHDSLPLFLTAEQWSIRLSLLCIGLRLDAPGYGKDQISLLFREIQSSLIEIPASLYKQALTALLTPSQSDSNDKHLPLDTSSLHAAATILEDMHFRGHEITPTVEPDSNKLRELLELAVLQARPADNTSPCLHPEAPQRLRRLLNKIYPSLPSLDLELRKLHACADTANYKGMWDIWHTFAADMRPRPVELYVAMFHSFADSGHQAKNMEALRVLVPEMAREEPPVMMDREVAEAVKRCILAVDPRVEEDAVSLYEDVGSGEGERMGELQKLWRRCESVIQEDGRWAREIDDD